MKYLKKFRIFESNVIEDVVISSDDLYDKIDSDDFENFNAKELKCIRSLYLFEDDFDLAIKNKYYLKYDSKYYLGYIPYTKQLDDSNRSKVKYADIIEGSRSYPYKEPKYYIETDNLFLLNERVIEYSMWSAMALYNNSKDIKFNYIIDYILRNTDNRDDYILFLIKISYKFFGLEDIKLLINTRHFNFGNKIREILNYLIYEYYTHTDTNETFYFKRKRSHDENLLYLLRNFLRNKEYSNICNEIIIDQLNYRNRIYSSRNFDRYIELLKILQKEKLIDLSYNDSEFVKKLDFKKNMMESYIYRYWIYIKMYLQLLYNVENINLGVDDNKVLRDLIDIYRKPPKNMDRYEREYIMTDCIPYLIASESVDKSIDNNILIKLYYKIGDYRRMEHLLKDSKVRKTINKRLYLKYKEYLDIFKTYSNY